ncbi:MAG TPA: ATP-binding protein [Phycisphaerales bacterium]|nr:ATP-binding protein [Phycisphaerales bacterium]
MAATPHAHPDAAQLRLVPARRDIDALHEAMGAAMGRHGYTEASRFAVRLAVEEALANAFHHGHRGLPPQTPVDLSYAVGPGLIEVTIKDRGPGFDPGAVPDPTLETNLELPSGRGLLLMRAYMTTVEFSERGTVVRMTYRRPAKG